MLKSLELFSGAGGLAFGLHQAGFKHQALIEFDLHSIKTLQLNCKTHLRIPQNRVHFIDARDFKYEDYEDRIDLLAGGPPCQPFSTGGKNLAHLDPRDMFPTFLKVVAKTRPKAILIENVKGLLRLKFSDYFDYILRQLMFPFEQTKSSNFIDQLHHLKKLKYKHFSDEETYKVTYQLIDTANYGVPQRRERVFITAFRSDLNISPHHIEPTHSKEVLLKDQFITKNYWKRHKIKPFEYLGPRDRGILESLKKSQPQLFPNKMKPWVTVRDSICDLPKPVERGERENLPNHVQFPGARIYSGHIGSYHDHPAKALKAGTHGTPGGENMLRINNTSKVRYFTTREAARLHTFPDSWIFNGETWGSCIKQLGNAVPVLVGKIFGDYIHSMLKKI